MLRRGKDWFVVKGWKRSKYRIMVGLKFLLHVSMMEGKKGGGNGGQPNFTRYDWHPLPNYLLSIYGEVVTMIIAARKCTFSWCRVMFLFFFSLCMWKVGMFKMGFKNWSEKEKWKKKKKRVNEKKRKECRCRRGCLGGVSYQCWFFSLWWNLMCRLG